MLPVDLQILRYLLLDKVKFHYKIKPYLNQHPYKDLNNRLQKQRIKEELYHIPLNQVPFTVFDLETTGFFPEVGHEIISIGAIRINGLESCSRKRFHKVIQPIRSVGTGTLNLTGITKQQLENGEPFISAFHEFLDFSQDSILVAHPAKFDMHFLKSLLKRWKLPDYHPLVVDSQSMAKWLLPDEKHQLDPLLKYFDIDRRIRHHALNDAIMTSELFVCLLQATLNRGVNNYQELQPLLERSVKDSKRTKAGRA
ncbi:PolC-type DNA polymerase III [Thalassobacillus pellis]|uniref:3'-5' exonuclease n=1 Tax=Thalassobacillus pellis TaxID=748008 RepID=UPI00195FEDB5|nr:exonuclease domain-containing protein [Thalassobacillus pellis]MBM7552350.1 DNA polymerase-3 subunit epsilon [Thalassobacillus pellis]